MILTLVVYSLLILSFGGAFLLTIKTAPPASSRRSNDIGEVLSGCLLLLAFIAFFISRLMHPHEKVHSNYTQNMETVQYMQLHDPPKIITESNPDPGSPDKQTDNIEVAKGSDVSNVTPDASSTADDSFSTSSVDSFDIGDPTGDEDAVYNSSSVQKMAEFGEGEDSYYSYIMGCPYPDQAKKNQIEGTVYISFVVGKDGVVKEVKLVKGADPILNDAALRHMKKMPKWKKPAQQDGRAVDVLYLAHIEFKLK